MAPSHDRDSLEPAPCSFPYILSLARSMTPRQLPTTAETGRTNASKSNRPNTPSSTSEVSTKYHVVEFAVIDSQSAVSSLVALMSNPCHSQANECEADQRLPVQKLRASHAGTHLRERELRQVIG